MYSSLILCAKGLENVEFPSQWNMGGAIISHLFHDNYS